MVLFQLFAFLHALLPEISAKGITDLPLCSLSCVTREAVDLRCLLYVRSRSSDHDLSFHAFLSPRLHRTDTGCLCSKPTFITGTVTCAQSHCKRPDLSKANGVLTEMCAAGMWCLTMSDVYLAKHFVLKSLFLLHPRCRPPHHQAPHRS